MPGSAIPSLNWVDINRVIDFAALRFKKSVETVRRAEAAATRVDPTLAIVRAGILGQPIVAEDDIDATVSITKTIQNAVGLFHQDVLGAVEGWSSSGPSGGAIDLKGVSPITQQPIVAELKMRWNTIKASDEKNTWDALKQAATVSSPETVAYVFQIVPKTNTPYDIPWKVSGRESIDRVRCADGVTAYHLVTGNPDALFELLAALPYIVGQVLSRQLGDEASAEFAFLHRESVVKELMAASLPPQSAHASSE